MFAVSRRVYAALVSALMLGSTSVVAFAEGSVLSNPVDNARETQTGSAVPEIIPGVSNTDLAFVAVMLVLLAGLIWMWMRGGAMQRQADLNASILNRAASRRPAVMDDAQLAAAEAKDNANKSAEVQDMVAGRMGLRSQE